MQHVAFIVRLGCIFVRGMIDPLYSYKHPDAKLCHFGSGSRVAEYIHSASSLERDHPNITFAYNDT